MKRTNLALALLCVAQFVNVLDVNVVIVALPSIQRSLGFSQEDLQWVFSAYVLFFAGFLLLAGRMADLFGRRRMFMAGLGLFALASLVCGLADSPLVLLAARAAQGLGAAITAPAALSIITTTFSEGPERNRALGVWTAVAAAGGAAGLVLGGLITDGLGWEWVFLINVPVGVLGVALAPMLLSESRDVAASRQLDISGAVTITASLVLLVYGFTVSEDSGFGSLAAVTTLVLSAALFAVFVSIESRAANPLVPLGVFHSRNLVGALFVTFTLTATTSPVGMLATIYLQRVLDYSPTFAGLTLLPLSILVIVGSLIGARLAGSLGVRVTMVSGLVMIATATLLMLGISAASGLAYVLASAILAGLGLGCASVAATSAGTSAVRHTAQGLASGLLNTFAQIGTAIGLALLTTLAAARTAGRPGEIFLVEGYRLAFAAGAGIALAGCLAAILLVSKKGAREIA